MDGVSNGEGEAARQTLSPGEALRINAWYQSRYLANSILRRFLKLPLENPDEWGQGPLQRNAVDPLMPRDAQDVDPFAPKGRHVTGRKFSSQEVAEIEGSDIFKQAVTRLSKMLLIDVTFLSYFECDNASTFSVPDETILACAYKWRSLTLNGKPIFAGHYLLNLSSSYLHLAQLKGMIRDAGKAEAKRLPRGTTPTRRLPVGPWLGMRPGSPTLQPIDGILWRQCSFVGLYGHELGFADYDSYRVRANGQDYPITLTILREQFDTNVTFFENIRLDALSFADLLQLDRSRFIYPTPICTGHRPARAPADHDQATRNADKIRSRAWKKNTAPIVVDMDSVRRTVQADFEANYDAGATRRKMLDLLALGPATVDEERDGSGQIHSLGLPRFLSNWRSLRRMVAAKRMSPLILLLITFFTATAMTSTKPETSMMLGDLFLAWAGLAESTSEGRGDLPIEEAQVAQMIFCNLITDLDASLNPAVRSKGTVEDLWKWIEGLWQNGRSGASGRHLVKPRDPRKIAPHSNRLADNAPQDELSVASRYARNVDETFWAFTTQKSWAPCLSILKYYTFSERLLFIFLFQSDLINLREKTRRGRGVRGPPDQ